MIGYKIPFCGIDRQYKNLKDEITDITDKVLSSGKLLHRDYTAAFSKAIADRCDRKYAIPVNSCTAGLNIIIDSLITIDETITKIAIPTFSYHATAHVVNERPSLEVDFIDVDSNTGIMDLDDLGADTITQDLIMYVNLYGNVIDYDRMKLITHFFNKSRPFIIEDAAQSFGSSYKNIPSGKLGDISVLSFDPTKNLPNYGTGGMILTDDISTFTALNYRTGSNNNGSLYNVKFASGTNTTMSEVDCASMLIKLQHFDAWQQRRTEIAKYYTDNLNSELIITPHQFITEGVIPNWHKYVIQIDHRAKLKKVLDEAGIIETKIHYEYALSDSPHANNLTHKVLSLPIYPELSDNEVEYVVSTINEKVLSI